MPRPTGRNTFPKPLRMRALRRDAKVGRAERRMERVFNLPTGSVRLYRPSGRRARSDKSVDRLLKDWGW
jgi:hypothetical protein